MTKFDLDFSELHSFSAHLAILAGSYLREQALARTQGARSFDESITIKENAADLVTHADMHAEQLISDAIREKYPEHK